MAGIDELVEQALKNGEVPIRKIPKFGFHSHNEELNGRLAMMGFFSLVALEKFYLHHAVLCSTGPILQSTFRLNVVCNITSSIGSSCISGEVHRDLFPETQQLDVD
eukprot:g30533.t1